MATSPRSRLATTAALTRVACTYLLFAGLKRFVPLKTLARWAWAAPGAPDARRRAASIGDVIRVSRLVGADRGDCLQSALVLYRELSRAGDGPVLVVGLARDVGRTIGHAWVEVGGTPVVEDPGTLKRFARTACFGERGRLLPGAR